MRKYSFYEVGESKESWEKLGKVEKYIGKVD